MAMRFLLVLLCPAPVAASAGAAGEIEHWHMNEEWYDWHPRAGFQTDGAGALTVEVHFVGPGAVTPRGIYARGDADAPLEEIRV